MSKAKSIAPIEGWILIAENDTGWHIAWIGIFPLKRQAIEFAKFNKWPEGYRAVRGRITGVQ